MLFEDDPRDLRKKRFIQIIRDRKARELLGPLSEKIAAWEKGELDAAEVFKTAGYAGRKGEALIADFKKKPDVILAGIAMDDNRISSGVGDVGIEVRLADICEVFSDAVVSPVDPDGAMTAGAALAIIERGGAGIGEEAKGKGPVAACGAFSTGAGELATGAVIHAAVAGEDGAITAQSVKAAVVAALAEAETLEAETVAIPGLGVVEGGISAEESAAAIVGAIADHKADSVSKIVITDIDEGVVVAFVAELERREAEE